MNGPAPCRITRDFSLAMTTPSSVPATSHINADAVLLYTKKGLNASPNASKFKQILTKSKKAQYTDKKCMF